MPRIIKPPGLVGANGFFGFPPEFSLFDRRRRPVRRNKRQRTCNVISTYRSSDVRTRVVSYVRFYRTGAGGYEHTLSKTTKKYVRLGQSRLLSSGNVRYAFSRPPFWSFPLSLRSITPVPPPLRLSRSATTRPGSFGRQIFGVYDEWSTRTNERKN